ncbi:MAG TPA: TonB-dependent receptor [Longimicrobiales bacterium]|nr:TonB-dependent receptor [Longimicrobiales bacterium]
MAAPSPTARALLLVLATALAGTRGALAQEDSAAASVLVSGRVRDGSTGRPVPQARVWLRTDSTAGVRIVWSGITDEDGEFWATPLAQGMLEIHVEAFGYRDTSGPVEAIAVGEVAVSVDLVPAPLEMEPVIVAIGRRSRLATSGFYERRRQGQGYFITRQEFEKRSPTRPSDIFRTMPGVQLVPTPRLGSAVLRFRGCTPDVVLDGILLVRPTSVDDIVRVGDIEAVELKSGAYLQTRPGASPCGTVTIWTREGGRDVNDRPMTWRRWLAAGGLVLVALVLTR